MRYLKFKNVNSKIQECQVEQDQKKYPMLQSIFSQIK